MMAAYGKRALFLLLLTYRYASIIQPGFPRQPRHAHPAGDRAGNRQRDLRIDPHRPAARVAAARRPAGMDDRGHPDPIGSAVVSGLAGDEREPGDPSDRRLPV